MAARREKQAPGTPKCEHSGRAVGRRPLPVKAPPAGRVGRCFAPPGNLAYAPSWMFTILASSCGRSTAMFLVKLTAGVLYLIWLAVIIGIAATSEQMSDRMLAHGAAGWFAVTFGLLAFGPALAIGLIGKGIRRTVRLISADPT
jgi:hypothetical protein